MWKLEKYGYFGKIRINHIHNNIHIVCVNTLYYRCDPSLPLECPLCNEKVPNHIRLQANILGTHNFICTGNWCPYTFWYSEKDFISGAFIRSGNRIDYLPRYCKIEYMIEVEKEFSKYCKTLRYAVEMGL